ncbi:hypothetical protein [Bradyrhizobium ottawaense]|uniref:hypothetical protein n=1 Tax=Bradyrhizobium ottawaense TaxID=931866 RepID=UPI00351271C9
MTVESKLSIDKISITIRDPNRDRINQIYSNLKALSQSPHADRYQIKPSRWRMLECSVPVPVADRYSSDRVRFEVGARHGYHPDYRLEFNPSKIAPNGIIELCGFIATVTGVDLKGLLFNGIVTRIDIALDLYGLSLNEVIVRSRGAQKIGLYTDRHGNPQSVILGTPRSNRTVAYSKLHDDGRSSLRLERRLKPRFRLHDLDALTAPFANVHMIPTEAFSPHLNGIEPEHFFDSIRVRGLSRVINKLPTAQRRAIKTMLQDKGNSVIPSAESIWRHWPELLHENGLGTQ